MPRLPGLEFVAHGLSVSYCASSDLQDLDIQLDFTKKNSKAAPKRRVLALKRFVDQGFAGSDVFPPQDGALAIRKMPPGRLEAVGKNFALAMKVKAVAPIALRHAVERLRLAASPTEQAMVASMTIHGSKPLDGGPLSVTEREVRSWFDDPAAAPRVWPKLPFDVKDKGPASDVAWRVVLGANLTPAARDELEQRAITWPTTWSLDDANRVAPARVEARLPGFFAAKREFTARFKTLALNRKVMRGLILNALASFHHNVMPIVEVELSL